MNKAIALLPLAIFSLAGCITVGNDADPPMSQLQVREMQTRTYTTGDQTLVMKAMINVLQDENFILKNADSQLGFLTATKEVDVERKGAAFFGTMFGGRDARWNKNSIIECSANVSVVGEECRVRANFQRKLLDNVGNVVTVESMDDPVYFQEFFSRVDKGIFLQKEGV